MARAFDVVDLDFDEARLSEGFRGVPELVRVGPVAPPEFEVFFVRLVAGEIPPSSRAKSSSSCPSWSILVDSVFRSWFRGIPSNCSWCRHVKSRSSLNR